MKKTILIRVLCIALILLVIGITIICQSTDIPMGTAVLQYEGKEVTLTQEEAFRMRCIFSFKFYEYGIGGCPYEEDISITFGNTVYAIATDGCYTAKDWHGEHYISFNSVEFDAIAALFEKYFGKTVIY